MNINPNARCRFSWGKYGHSPEVDNMAQPGRYAISWMEEQKSNPQIEWAKVEDYGTNEVYLEFHR